MKGLCFFLRARRGSNAASLTVDVEESCSAPNIVSLPPDCFEDSSFFADLEGLSFTMNLWNLGLPFCPPVRGP